MTSVKDGEVFNSRQNRDKNRDKTKTEVNLQRFTSAEKLILLSIAISGA